ncbi:MAG: phosphoribosylformylglycinamidine synthase subunit PurS [Pseudothermotoga sp.]
MYKAKIEITFKNGVLDPQGNAVKQALHHLGFEKITEVRIGKLIELFFDLNDKEAIQSQINEMCEKLLANPVIEKYSILSLEEIE